MEGWFTVRLSEKICLVQLLAIKEFEEDIQSKREMKINEDYMVESTLDIWCKKREAYPKLIQYEIHKCFILKFELAFSGFINPVVDLFHYTLKDIVFCDKIDEVTEDNIEQYYGRGMILDKYTSSAFIRVTI